MKSVTLTSKVEGLTVEISLAQDVMIMGSRCYGNLDCFLLAIFSLYNPGKEKNGMEKKWGTFENLTMWKHKTNTKFVYVLTHLKCTYHF